MARRAFLLRDLIVLAGVMRLALSLAIPAIARVQEQAKDMQCRDNLKKLAEGVLKFHEQHNRFPTGGDDYFMGPSYDANGVPLLPPHRCPPRAHPRLRPPRRPALS